MSFALADLALMMAYAIGGIWLLLGLARVQSAWEKSQSRTATLRFALQNTARQLMSKLEELKRLDAQIVDAKKNVDIAKEDQRARSTALANAGPPVPEELFVAAEFPSSRKDVAWVAEFERLPTAPPAVPGERAPEVMVFWAHNHSAAGARARQLIADFKAYDLKGLRRLDA